MITVGIAREAAFIAKALNRFVTIDIKTDAWNKISIDVGPNLMMWVHYNKIKIWKESLDDSDFWGVESCDSISRIIACIDNKDDSWPSKYPSPEKIS